MSVFEAFLAPLRSRGAASEILAKVASLCAAGRWPEEITPRQAGFAVARALGTFFDPNAVRAEFLAGFDEYCAQRRAQ